MPDEKKKTDVTLTIDGVQVTVPAGTLLVEASKLIKREIPVYCYHEKLGPAGLCRICLVEIEKTPKLQIACNTVCTEGMVVHTASEKSYEGRRAVLEFLLANHPLDCPICDKGGECDLQDYAIAYGPGSSRMLEPKARKPKAIDLGPTIVLDDERCIVCQRCSRFDDIITQERSLIVRERGQRDVISTATDQPYVSHFSGNTTELCPVGALTSKTYRFKSRPWDLRRTQTTCTQCSVGCAQFVDVRNNAVQRTMLVPDDTVSDGWLCDRGRYNVGALSDPERLTTPLLRQGDEWKQIDWDDAITLWARALKDHPARANAVLGGGRLLNEEAFLVRHVFGALGVESFDWRVGAQRTLTALRLGTIADLERANTIVVLGAPPAQTAPVLDLRIRKAVSRTGARLVVVGPQSAGSFVRETRVRDVAAIPEDALAAERLVVVTDGTQPELVDALQARLRALRADKGSSVVALVTGEQANVRGAQAAGLIPRDGGLDTAGIFAAGADGKIGTLAIFGANPSLRFPDFGVVDRALGAVEFTVVTELFLTETAKRATLVLPARSSLEKNGTTTNLAGEIRAVRASVPPPSGTLSDGDMLIALAAELGVALPTTDEITLRVREAVGAMPLVAPLGTTPGVLKGEGLELVVAQHPFAGGGTSLHDAAIAGLRPKPTVTVSPAAASNAGVAAGDVVDLTASGRALRELTVVVDARVDDDVAVVIGGLPEAPVGTLPPRTRVRLDNQRTAEATREPVGGGAR